MDRNDDHSSNQNSTLDSSIDQIPHSNSNIPTFKIENENCGASGSANDGDSNVETNGSTTSNDSDDPKDSSQHLAVPSKEPRMQRSSSLKIAKSSDGESSSDRKIVRFADALGLDLVDVKVFVNDGSLPKVPSRAFKNLNVNDMPSSPRSKRRLSLNKYELVPQFEQPGSDANFLSKVKDQKVCLENVIIDCLQLTGIVRTSNLHFKKVVLVKYTIDGWISVHEHTAEYVEGSSDTITDKFSFVIHPKRLKPGDKLIFVVKYAVLDQEFWDNNNSYNYTLICKAKDECTHIDAIGRQPVSQ